MADFNWTNRTEEAAQLVADGQLTHEEIAAQVGVHRVTVSKWCSVPEFAAKVAELNEEFRKATANLAIARKEKRIAALNRRWLSMQKVVFERSETEAMQDVPGGRTGLITIGYKTLGSGESAQIMPVYEVDTGLLKELREHEKQAAIELGQWDVEKTEEKQGGLAAAAEILRERQRKRAASGHPGDVPG